MRPKPLMPTLRGALRDTEVVKEAWWAAETQGRSLSGTRTFVRCAYTTRIPWRRWWPRRQHEMRHGTWLICRTDRDQDWCQTRSLRFREREYSQANLGHTRMRANMQHTQHAEAYNRSKKPPTCAPTTQSRLDTETYDLDIVPDQSATRCADPSHGPGSATHTPHTTYPIRRVEATPQKGRERLG